MTKKPTKELAGIRNDRFIWKADELEMVTTGDGPVVYSFDHPSTEPSIQIPLVSPELNSTLDSIYEEIMWLAHRPTPGITAGRARGWYTHIMAESVKRKIRRFSGFVSEQAASDRKADLRLEHFLRIQNRLTRLVEKHRDEAIYDPGEFVQTILECERVHIVTSQENYAAMRAKGDYDKASIHLVPWSEIQEERRAVLWNKMLCNRVANANDFASGGLSKG